MESRKSLVDDIFGLLKIFEDVIGGSPREKVSVALWSMLYRCPVEQLLEMRNGLQEVFNDGDLRSLRDCSSKFYVDFPNAFGRALRAFQRGYIEDKEDDEESSDCNDDNDDKNGTNEVENDDSKDETEEDEDDDNEVVNDGESCRGLFPARTKKILPTETKVRRNQTVMKNAFTRDSESCVFLGTPDPQACFIFPRSLLHQGRIWDFFREFRLCGNGWLGEELAESLYQKLYWSDRIIDTTRNLICIDARLRKYLSEGRLALKPVGGPYQEKTAGYDEAGMEHAPTTPTTTPSSSGLEDPRVKRLKVDAEGLWCQKIRFHWTRQIQSLKMGEMDEMDPYTDPCTLLPVHLPMPCGPPDGKIITIKAEHKLDLPDPDILMLQFLLITGWAMAAGQEPKRFNFDLDYDTDRFWEARRKRQAKKKARQRETRETTEMTTETTTETMTEMTNGELGTKGYFEALEDKTSKIDDIYGLLQSCLKETNRNDAVFHASLWCVLYQVDSDRLGETCNTLRELLGGKDTKEILLFMDHIEEASMAFERSLHLFHKGHDLYESFSVDEKKKRCEPNVVRDALNRDDGKCVLLGTADPKTCHIIVPFAIKAFLAELTRIPAMFPADLLDRVRDKLQSDSNTLGSTRNVLSMNTQMRQYWADGRFSLEPWGEPYQETTERRRTGTGGLWCQEVRFHWMRQTKINMQEKWDGRGQDLRDLLPPRLGRYDHWSVKTGRVIQDGDIIAIKAKNKFDLPDRDILEIQHRLLSGWSLAAGVEPKDFTFEDEDLDQP